MQVLRNLRRPRFLAASAAVVVAGAGIFVASGPPARSATGQVAPVIDTSYMYGQLFNLGYNDVYRVSGADGDPRNLQRSVQHPVHHQRVAGVLEDVEDPADGHVGHGQRREVRDGLGPLLPPRCLSSGRTRTTRSTRTTSSTPTTPRSRFRARRARASACCSPRTATWHRSARRSSARSTTRRGSTSAIDGFNAARRHITLSNLSNGGAYDDTSGVSMTMAEYQALHEVVRGERHVSLQDLQGRAARRGRRPGQGRDVHARGLEVLRGQPHPEGPAGPVRDVRSDERERRQLSRVPLRHAVLLEQRHQRRRRPVAHVHH